MIIGLTGGSGTGKSTACRFFEDKGFFIIDCDVLAREVCLPGERCLEEIADSFGDEVIADDGSLKRQTLAQIVFSSPDKLKLLNSITHKHIIQRIYNIIEEKRRKNIVIDAPLLFEAGLETVCSCVIGVLADESKRLDRICKRDLISASLAKKRISSQHSDGFYEDKCDFVVYNNDTGEELFCRLEEIYQNLGGNNVTK